MLAALKRIYRSAVFRLSMIAAALFVASSFVVLGYIYFATVSSQLRAIDSELMAELDELETLYNESGAGAANREIIFRTRPGGQNIYFYQHPFGVTANLSSYPNVEQKRDANEIILFTYDFLEDQNDLDRVSEHRARGMYRPFSESAILFVARDTEFIMTTSERVRRALLIAMGIALALGLISGVYVSSRFARRIDSFNKLATDIRGGDFSRRAKRTQSGDELDDLADHLNGMLDHIDRLMSAMRYAGDSIAHDLRSPLTRLRTTLEATATQVKDPMAQEALLNAADDADGLLKTFESVLRIARLEAGDRRELLIAVNPKPLIDDLAELYEPSCEEAGLSFSSDIEAGNTILADRGLLSQAVSNLIENAIKYTPEGGQIKVALKRQRDGRIEISVTDNGSGIPAAERERVKERFVRLEKSRSLPGSGLGLSLVQAVADLHRAKFELSDGLVRSQQGQRAGQRGGQGHGLRASIKFPRAKIKHGSKGSGDKTGEGSLNKLRRKVSAKPDMAALDAAQLNKAIVDRTSSSGGLSSNASTARHVRPA